MQELASGWYALLGVLNRSVSEPLTVLADSIGLPIVSALLFGVLGATSPCQLSTNVSAMAYVAQGSGASASVRRTIAMRAMAYLIGKMLVYTVIGVAVILAGRELAVRSIPVVVLARKVLGPLMILLGLYLLGWIPLRFTVGHGLAEWIEDRAGGGVGGAFLLGTAFSFAFCPTLFLLFFGLTIPLALRSPVGVVYPGVFAFGTTLPLLAFAGLLTAGMVAAQGYLTKTRRVERWLRPIAAAVLILSGLNDTLTYWLL